MQYMIETERSDLFDVSIVIAMRIHIVGQVTEEGLKKAFDKTAASYEILNTRVVLEFCLSNLSSAIFSECLYI